MKEHTQEPKSNIKVRDERIAEKLQVLMEETGCQYQQAELALSLCEFDLEKAIYRVKSMLNDIIVIKGKFIISDQNLYGIFIIIIDKYNGNIIRIRSVVSYDPHIYETNIDEDWNEIEKKIYFFRLQEGVVQAIVYDIDKYFNMTINTNTDMILHFSEDNNLGKIVDLIFERFPYKEHSRLVRIEESNFTRFHHEKFMDKYSGNKSVNEPPDSKVFLQIELVEDRKGKRIGRLSKGDMVFAQIVDNRDIAKYLLNLLGTKENFFTVDNVIKVEDKTEIHLFLGSNILGKVVMPSADRIKILEKSESKWWEKFLEIFKFR